MNILSIILAAPQEGQNPMAMPILLVGMFVIFYFFMIRPQAKKQKALRKFREELKKGDKVVTMGGIHGKVIEVKEESVLVEIDNNVKVKVAVNAIAENFTDPSAKR